ncbi:MAG: J domain-containing protein [Acidimicrobiales bacterium]
MTHYEVLGVAVDAPTGAIRDAFVALARRHHPDYFVAASPKARTKAEQRMRDINEAWAVLSDPQRRTAYDRERGLAPEAATFQPFEPDDASDVDPRDEPDTPYRVVAPREERQTRIATLAPILLFAASVALFVFGLVLNVASVLALAVVVFMLSCAGFVLVPLLQLSRATRDEG